MLSAILDYETEDFYKEHKTFTFDTNILSNAGFGGAKGGKV